MHVRLKVTVCLYLSPNNRARSLSTLMAVIVSKDTKHSARLVALTAVYEYSQRPQCSWTKDIKKVAVRGWQTRHTNRSVVARLRYNSLDGRWREDFLWRATRMTEFPRNAVTERRMLTAAKETILGWGQPAKGLEGEHISSNVFVCVPHLVKFVVDIILYWTPFYLQVICDCNEKYFVETAHTQSRLLKPDFLNTYHKKTS